jgi:hypothetical protein
VSKEVSNLVFVALEHTVLRSADGVDASWAKDLDWLETYKRNDIDGFISLTLSSNNPFVLFAGTQSGVFNYIFPSMYIPAGTNSATISTEDKKQYYITVRASTTEGTDKRQYFFADSDEVGPAKSYANWFHKSRLNLVVILGLFLAFVLFYIRQTEKGRSVFVRRIPGLDAISEAVGRATEMGKPVLYVPGIDDMNNIQTIASMVILQSVTKIVAEYDSSIIVPICRPFVVPVAEETVKQGFMDAGRPDGYNPDNVRYISDEQFAYTAGVNGIMMREKPAANLYLGSFFAESLLLAETGFAEGAIQVSGTANVAQLPFFVAACDFTLIGEELFAASAYLSREPKLLGPLKASDLAKLIIMIVLVVGVALEMAGVTGFTNWFTVQ